ncbi:protein of unknown function DUF322 [Gottschalkia purinilytica]|uniref:Alkaline shock response membrane anchor protein AmaP n=1 Tax=Gottschalkia purinilytica TaxID=1503 RepID=A0A0L0W7X7_GOTPU|nr:alkaline shock response membrane anchor protein AmaP [Gottschalkia purinilytica]KNF07400.1 protein of unknown function DUF322 [Gottschalkia purinilytica]
MKIIDRMILTLYTFCLAIISVIFILIPFNVVEELSPNKIKTYVSIMTGNYLYSLIGIVFLLVSLKLLFSGVRKGDKSKHIMTVMNFGELRISSQAIEGLAHNVISKIIGIRECKIDVFFNNNSISIIIKGQVTPDVNIPEVTAEIQSKVKEHVEQSTGLEVGNVNLEVVSITTAMKVVK